MNHLKKITMLLLTLTVLLCNASCRTNNNTEDSKKLGASNTQVEKFAAHIIDNEYADAVALYNSEISGNSELEVEAANCMETYLSDLKSDILSGELDNSSAEIKENTVKKVYSSTNCKPKNYDSLINDIDEAFASKVAYKSGIAFFESGNYADAIAELSKVLPEDVNYKDAAEKQTSASEKYKEQVLNEVKDSISKNDYIKAIEILKNGIAILPNDVDIAAEIKTCEKNYISKLISDAEKSFSNYTKYKDALKIIQSGLQYFPDDQTLTDRRDYYNSFAPVKLSSLKEYDNYNMKIKENREDTRGNNHHTVFETASMWLDKNGYIVYVLDGKYNKITLTIFGIDPGYDYLSGVSLRDYSSGDYDTSTALYVDEEIKCSVLPYEIEVDVTGVQMLRLWCQTGVAVGDCVLQKTVK